MLEAELAAHRIEDNVPVLTLARPGTHGGLFDKCACCRRMGKPARRLFCAQRA